MPDTYQRNTDLPESLQDNGVAINLEDVMEEYRRESLRRLESLSYSLEGDFETSVNRLGSNLADMMSDYRYDARYVEEYTRDELYDFRKRTLKGKLDKVTEDVEQAINSAKKMVDEANQEHLKPEEIRGRVLTMIGKYNSFFEMPDVTWIEYATTEFSDNVLRKFGIENDELRYYMKRRISSFSDELMNEYYDQVRRLQTQLQDQFTMTTEQIELGLKQREKTNEEVLDPTLADPNEQIIQTEGKSQEELAQEKEEQLKKVMSDPNMTAEEKSAAYDQVAAKYDDAIAGLSTAPSRTDELRAMFR